MSLDVLGYLNPYEFTCELPGSKETVKFKPFTTGMMKKMLVYEDSTDPFVIEEMLDEIITSCVLDVDFDIDDLYLQDRFYLLMRIREKSKGDVYQYNFRCSGCKKDNVGSVKLSETKINPINEVFETIALSEQLSVKMKYLTRGEQKEIFDLVKGTKLTLEQQMIEATTMSVAQSMDEFTAEGVTSNEVLFKDKMEIINNRLDVQTFEKLKNCLSAHDFGMDFKIETKCANKKCGKTEVHRIPLDHFFD